MQTPSRRARFLESIGRCPFPVAGILAAVGLLHFAMLVRGFTHPDAVLLGDRSPGRLAMAQRFLASLSDGGLTDVLTHNGVPGDYVWHAIAFWLTGGSLGWIAMLQCALLMYALHELWKMAEALGATDSQRWIALAAYAAIPVDIAAPHVLNSEAWFTPLLMIGTRRLLDLCAGRASMRSAMVGGMCLGLGLLTRPEILPWLAVAALAVSIAAVWGPLWASRRRVLAWLAMLAVLPALWIGYQGAQTGVYGLGRSGADTATTIALRTSEVQSYAPQVKVTGDPGRMATLVSAAAQAPLTAGRIVAGHMAKTVFMPENLDIPAYFGLFQRTGVRATLVESQGLLGAMQSVFAEMPALVSWLMAEIALFALWWVVVLAGVWRVLKARQTEPIGTLLLLALPALCVLERVVSEGNSRKRSVVDFALALFFAFGWPWAVQRLRQWRGARAPD